MSSSDVTIVIPTYGRDRVLTETLSSLFPLRMGEVVVVDQSPTHDEETAALLTEWDTERRIRWLRLEQPSIPRAMNVGLSAARSPIVLFLDDDIEPRDGLVTAHARAHEAHEDAAAVVGQVLQPGQVTASREGTHRSEGLRADLEFPFWSDKPAWVKNVMAGNLSVKRERAIEAGGFDETFEGVAYRFETEFARRVIACGGKIRYEPTASIRHLRASRGGTRSMGSHLTSASPKHGMGDYYFAMRCGWNAETVSYMMLRPLREVRTRFHLRHPWWIPVKLVGEIRAMWHAFWCWNHGPRLMRGLKHEESVISESVSGRVVNNSSVAKQVGL